jgi:hypothetical protein
LVEASSKAADGVWARTEKVPNAMIDRKALKNILILTIILLLASGDTNQIPPAESGRERV